MHIVYVDATLSPPTFANATAYGLVFSPTDERRFFMDHRQVCLQEIRAHTASESLRAVRGDLNGRDKRFRNDQIRNGREIKRTNIQAVERTTTLTSLRFIHNSWILPVRGAA